MAAVFNHTCVVPFCAAHLCPSFVLQLYLTYGVSAPTGIFIPSLVIGATGGRLVGHLLQHTLAARGIAVPVGVVCTQLSDVLAVHQPWRQPFTLEVRGLYNLAKIAAVSC